MIMIRTNNVKAKINQMQQNSSCWFCGDRGEIINHIIMERSKLVQNEYKIRLGGEVDPLGIVQETEIQPYGQVVYAQPRIRPGE